METHPVNYGFHQTFLNYASTNASRSLPRLGNPQRAPLTPRHLEVSLLFNTSLINFVQTEQGRGGGGHEASYP